MLKYGEANPLTVFGLRRLEHCPPHFVKVEFDLRVQEKAIADWIWANVTGRFWYDDLYYTSDSGSTEFRKCAAFEIPGEASMFALILDTINTYNSDW
jgi:hypothetical protein